MGTHNICFCREIRKILCGYPLLSVAMVFAENQRQKHFIYSVKGCILNSNSVMSVTKNFTWNV